MAKTWILRGRHGVFKNQELRFDEVFRIDGRWSQATIRRKIIELRAEKSRQLGVPVEFYGYEVLGESSGLHYMPYVEAHAYWCEVDGAQFHWHRTHRDEAVRGYFRGEVGILSFQRNERGQWIATIKVDRRQPISGEPSFFKSHAVSLMVREWLRADVIPGVSSAPGVR